MRVADSSFGVLLEGAPDAMVCVDRRGRIARVNVRTERLFGYQRDELVGEPAEILIPEMVLSCLATPGEPWTLRGSRKPASTSSRNRSAKLSCSPR